MKGKCSANGVLTKVIWLRLRGAATGADTAMLSERVDMLRVAGNFPAQVSFGTRRCAGRNRGQVMVCGVMVASRRLSSRLPPRLSGPEQGTDP